MGVSGSGKTTVGRLVAQRLGVAFADADDFHPPSNVEKMARGRALGDADRAPWLARLHALLETWRASGRGGVLACSALKVAYRDTLDVGGVAFRLLTASPEMLRRRLRHRPEHFFDPALLGSQLATLEVPSGTRAFDTSQATPEQVADAIVASLG